MKLNYNWMALLCMGLSVPMVYHLATRDQRGGGPGVRFATYNLALNRPGDWLYIVNDPHRTPVGTHSVMFVRWEDRARGYARVISHPGWFAGPHTGREGTYDVSRTYRIIRPTM